jgi:DNA-binding response OmpR family regulator
VIGLLGGRTVLLFVEHPTTLQAVAAAVERAGARSVRARSYQEALPLAILEKIDAIVCDLGTVSRRDGFELLRTVRELSEVVPHFGSLRALALGELTTRGPDSEAVLFDDRLEKSSSAGTVVNRLAVLLHLESTRSRPAA